MAAAQEEQYSVEALVDLKVIGGKEYVLVKWKGYPDEEDNTWESAIELETDFHDEIQELREARQAAQTPKRKKRVRVVRQKPAATPSDGGAAASSEVEVIEQTNSSSTTATSKGPTTPPPEENEQASFNNPPTRLARSAERGLAESNASELNDGEKSPASGDSPLLDPEDVPEAEKNISKTKMLLPAWTKALFKTPQAPPSPKVDDSNNQAVEPDTPATPVTHADSEPEVDQKAATKRIAAKRKLESSLQAPRRRRRLNESDAEEAAEVKPSAAAKKSVAAARRQAAAQKAKPEPLAGYMPGTAPITAPVTLLSPEYVRSIIRDELDRHREISKTPSPVKVRAVGMPPEGATATSNKWGLVEDLTTGKQIYLPLDDIRKQHGNALVDYLLATGALHD